MDGERKRCLKSPHAAHERLLETLHTYICNKSSHSWVAGRIYAFLHHLVGGMSDLEKGREIGVMVLTMDNIDNALTIIYRYTLTMLTTI